MKLTSALFWAAMIQLSLGEVARADAPPPGQFAIDNFTFNGDGCRPGSVAANVSPDGQAFTLMFDNFIVEAYGSARQARKLCTLDIKLRVPSGWSVGVATADVRGYASLLDPMSFGVVNSAYTLRGANRSTSVMRQKFQGPFDDNYHLRHQAALNTITYSKCGRQRVMRLRTGIRARVSPRAPNAGALMTVDSIDGEVLQRYGIVWKRCSRDDPDDTGNFPDLPANYTAVCKSVLKNRQGQILDTYEGAAVDEKQQVALRQAEQDAKQQCRVDRRATPQTSCEVVAGSCQVVQD